MELQQFGRRICILGPSNSGKSTLAAALGRKLDIPAIHLDQLHHQPHTDWVPRPAEEFVALHNEAVAGAEWVMDGNYSRCMPQRLARSTGLILIYPPRLTNFGRYLRRTLLQRQRAGALEGGQDSLKWHMVRWVLYDGPKRHKGLLARYAAYDGSKIYLRSMRDLNRLYAEWGLSRAPR